MDVVDSFAAEAELFVRWAEAGADAGALAARNGLLRLMRLYLAALELPITDCDDDDDPPGIRVDAAEWKSIFARALRLPLNFFLR